MEEKEIDLREIFQIIWKRKGTIILVFLVATVTSIIVSLSLPKIYQAKAVLMIMKPRGTLSMKGIGFGYSIDTYKMLIKNDRIEKAVIETLHLNNPNHKIDISTLDKMIEVEQIRDTELLSVSVENKDPLLAKQIVNCISEIAVLESQKIVNKQIDDSKDFLYQQLKDAKRRLKKADDRLLEFKKKANLNTLRKEIEIRLQEKGKFEIAYSDSKMKEKEQEARLKELKNQLDKRERVIAISRSLVEDPAFQQVVEKVTDSELQSVLNLKIENEEINETYQGLDREYANTLVSLAELRTNLENLEKNLKKNEKELGILHKELAEKEITLEQLERDHSLATKTYNMLCNNYEGSQIVEASKIGILKIISPALTPEKPIKPKKRLIVAIAGLLSLMGGVGLAFAFEYLGTDKS
ncbi:MAG: GNVR domain-containing protein [bacterium]|nr:GNVR domain-containing protein [bacterium]